MARFATEGDKGDPEDQPKKVDEQLPILDESCGAVGGQLDDDGKESFAEDISFSEGQSTEEGVEGQHLYVDFLRREIQTRGLEPPECLREFDNDAPSAESLILWSRTGLELRHLADTFARSKERQHVRARASQVDLESISLPHFMELLHELFQGEGVTRERILVLFFFCADVAIAALNQGSAKTFKMLMKWSAYYISTRVATWVHNHGGWGIVLRSSLNVACQLSALCAFVTIAITCVVFIRRNLN